MRVAVLTLTRNRLEYSKACFAALRKHAGCPFDHYVFDNGSSDWTFQWLLTEFEHDRIHILGGHSSNQGVHPALNLLLDEVGDQYDVVVNVDNDCELIVPDTLRVTCEFALAHPGSVVAPHTQGLRYPPTVRHEKTVDGYRIGVTDQVGGICMPLPPGHRYDESGPVWGDGDSRICARANERGRLVGYLLDYPVNHMETTDGQHVRYPEYFAERVAQGGPD